MERTLGGDRLGSGKKQKVYLHGYERSTHDLGYIWRSTMASGTLVPFMVEVGLPGDTFDINLDAYVNTLPTIGPLFGSYKLQLDVLQAAIRLYQGQLHNNKLKIGMKMSDVKLPIIEMAATKTQDATDISVAQINPSCLLTYLGIRGVGKVKDDNANPIEGRTFNAVPFLAYWDIYKNYYANKQEEIGAVIHTPLQEPEDIASVEIEGVDCVGKVMPKSEIVVTWTTTAGNPDDVEIQLNGAGWLNITEIWTTNNTVGLVTTYTTYNNDYNGQEILAWRKKTNVDPVTLPIQIETFDLENIDIMRERILAHSVNNTPFNVTNQSLEPYSYVLEVQDTYTAYMNTQEGLGLKTYQSDLFNNWLSTEWIDGAGGISEISAVDVTDGFLTMDALALSKKVYNMLNRIMVSGGTYDDWLDAVYTNERTLRAETPVYEGGLIKEIIFQEVVSTAETTDKPQGNLAGRGTLSNKHKGGKIVVKIDEPAIIMGIVSITPRIDYSQGNSWHVNLKTMDDFHKPALDEIGFQDLITEQMAWWTTVWNATTSKWEQKSAGKQPAWINYMTNVNRTYGNFAIEDDQMWMTLNRRYEATNNQEDIEDLTTYIDPAKYNNIFAQESLDSQNFWVQIGVDITARRKMSAKVMPNL